MTARSETVFIGWDPNEILAYDVASKSLLRHSTLNTQVQPIILREQVLLLTRRVERRDGRLFCPISQAPMTTEFAISRFCVPFLKTWGWALFADCDVLFRADVGELFSLSDERYAVMVVKHAGLIEVADPGCYVWGEQGQSNIHKLLAEGKAVQWYGTYVDFKQKAAQYFPEAETWYTERNGDGICMLVPVGTPHGRLPIGAIDYVVDEWIDPSANFGSGVHTFRKMDKQPQTHYSRKNWSSVVLWNTSHPANKALTLEALNTWPGRDLHAFKWLADDLIGELPPEWNYLVGVSPKMDNPKLVHFTLGTPNLPGYENAEFADEWRSYLGH